MVLSGCLVQFFIIPNVGAMITAALLTSLGALFWAILKRIDPRSHGILWAWLPVLSLLFVQWDFNYRFQGTVAFGMMLLALYLVLGIRNFIPRLIASLFASLLLFGLAGPVSFHEPDAPLVLFCDFTDDRVDLGWIMCALLGDRRIPLCLFTG